MKQEHSDTYPEKFYLSRYSLCSSRLFHHVIAALALFLLFAFAACPLRAKAAGNYNIRNIRDEIQHADTYYWLGMHEKGNVDAFHRGLSHLAAASTLIKKNHHDIPSKDIKQLDLEIKTLFKDLQKQLKVHGDTLYGVFPLLRLIQPTLFSNALTTGTFELVDDPDVMASTTAGYKLCHQVLKSLSAKTQFHLLVNSIPRNIELENEMVNIFNEASGFFIHNQRQLAEILDIDQLKNFNNGKISFTTQQQVNQALETKQFLLLTLRKIDQINNNYFYVLDGQVFNYDKGKTYHCSSMGFSRNRNGQFWPIILSQIALFLMVIFFTYFTVRFKEKKAQIKSLYFSAPIAGFILGRLIPWILVPILSPLAPKPDTLAILSFWWPLGLIFLLFSIPVFIYYLSNNFFQIHTPSLAINNRGNLVIASVALGVCAYLATPIYLYAENKGIIILLALVLASIFLFSFLGTLIDPSESIEHDLFTIIILLLLFVQGGIVAHLEISLIWGYTVTIILLLTFIYCKNRLLEMFIHFKNRLFVAAEGIDKDENKSPTVNANPPKTIEELKTYALNPPFIYETSLFKNLEKRLSKINSGTIRIGVSGSQGIGKTTVITNIFSRITQQFKDPFLTLSGNCPKPLKSVHNDLPYAPFQSILTTTIGIDITGSGDHKVKGIGTLFGTVIHTIIPTFQLSAELNSKPCERCLEDIYYNIAQRLRKLAEKQHVAIFIDDLQWIDKDSTALLAYLLNAFPEEGTNKENKYAVIIILAGDNEKQIKNLLKKDPVKNSLTFREQQEILIHSLNIAPASAKKLIEYIEGGSENQKTLSIKQKGMDWVFKIIYWLAQNNCLELEKKYNQWIINQKIMDTTVIPDELAKVINDRIEKVKEHKLLIMHAACLGEIFSGKILADSLRQDKYEVYQILAKIEKTTGLIIDIKTDDEYYKFQSPFDLNAVREFLGIIDDSTDNVSQVVRECFARTAAAMENDPRFSNKLYEIANHYCHAGYSYASKSTQYCLLAARYACNHYQFDTARKYLEKCGEYAYDIHVCSNTIAQELEEERLIVSCDETHVTGKNRGKTAESGLKYVEEHQDAPFRIYKTVIRACYDAKKFTETFNLGKEILSRFRKPNEQAEAYQFIGIASDTPEKREENLNQAMEQLSKYLRNKSDDQDALALQGRVFNSVAKHHEQANNIDKAKDFFGQSITIKEKLNDTLGLAMSHGGLGRLELRRHHFDEAIQHLEKNLSYAEKAGDFYTPFYTNSALGDCYLGKANIKGSDVTAYGNLNMKALEHFKISFEFLLANEQKNNFEELKQKLKKEIKDLVMKIETCLDPAKNQGDFENFSCKLSEFCSRHDIKLKTQPTEG